MSRLTDQGYLRDDQYRDATNLRSRMTLHERFSTNPYGWPRWVFDQFDIPPHGRVLELGCGPGALWIENLGRVPDGWRVTLSDLSPGMVEEARARLVGHPAFAAFAVADAQDLPFAAGGFDAVVANHMLYHVPERARALAEIRRVLRPGGRLYAATNGLGHMRELDDLGRRLAPDDYPEARGSGQALGFNLEGGGEELARVFTRVELRRYDDGLVVTEAAPLVDYLLSMGGMAGWRGRRPEGSRARLIASVREEIERAGAIRVTKSTGLFIAER